MSAARWETPGERQEALGIREVEWREERCAGCGASEGVTSADGKLYTCDVCRDAAAAFGCPS